MKPIFRLLPLFTLLLAGCGSDAAVDSADQQAARFAATCSLSVRLADAQGVVAASPIIEPTHVAKIEAATAIAPGDHAVMVKLTPLGERRMQMHTRDAVGQSAVIFCGEKEVTRARIMEPLGSSFQVNVPEGFGL